MHGLSARPDVSRGDSMLAPKIDGSVWVEQGSFKLERCPAGYYVFPASVDAANAGQQERLTCIKGGVRRRSAVCDLNGMSSWLRHLQGGGEHGRVRALPGKHLRRDIIRVSPRRLSVRVRVRVTVTVPAAGRPALDLRRLFGVRGLGPGPL